MKLSDIKLYTYFKHNGRILQLIDHDFLDQWVVGYDNNTDEAINMNIYTEVEPVQVIIAELNVPDIEQLQARIKELESEQYINEIKAQGIEQFMRETKHHERFMGFINNGDAVFWYCYHQHELKNYINKLRINHDNQ